MKIIFSKEHEDLMNKLDDISLMYYNLFQNDKISQLEYMHTKDSITNLKVRLAEIAIPERLILNNNSTIEGKNEI